MDVALIDYGAGNLHSASKALERAASEAGLAATIHVTRDLVKIGVADKIVLPGVGAFADCLAGIMAIPGLRETLQERVIEKAVPFLGICVGMQLMAARGWEFGTHEGFGWIDGDVRAIAPDDDRLKIPHMGWNRLEGLDETAHPVLAGLSDLGGGYAYFVHSFAIEPVDPAHIFARVDYGGPVVAMVGRDNMIGTQFHPEKSQALGLGLIRNFLMRL